jgi:hypothetical protein
MFADIVMKKALGRAAQQCAGGHHFGIEQRVFAQKPPKIPAVAIAPIHHRRNAEAIVGG